MNLLRRSQALVMKPMASDLRAVQRRSWLVGGVLMLALAGLGLRSWNVAVAQHEPLAEQGNRQQLRSYKVKASRGDVVDRSYISLAVTDRVHKIVLNPRLITAQEQTEAVIAAIIELFPGEDPEYLREELSQDKAYRRLRMVLDDPQTDALRAKKLPGVSLEPVPHRVYPRKLLASHVLGRVNAQGKGNLGIEYGLDEHLRGRDAMSPAYFARGKKLLTEGFPDPGVSRGHTVVLTIDSAIQAMAEEEINTLVENWTPVSASIVVMDPKTGEVLAMTSRPTFDPNHPIERLPQTVNQAVQADFEPGSTMKAITVAAALEQGVIRKDESFFCENGRWQYTDEHAIKDTKRSEWLSVTEILAVSSNICTTKIYERLRKESLHRWARRFHFGERPAIELPGATAGVLHHWEKWSDIQGANVSFGQGMTASPLQVAAAFSVLANDGVYNPPTIVRQVIDADGEPVELPRPEPERVVRIATAKTVLEMLESVVHTKAGTGRNAVIEGYRVAGKTSTAQKANHESGGYAEDDYFASFVGAVPARDPRVVILVSVDSPQGGHYGNEVAAPTFSRLGTRVMTYLGVEREDGTRPALDPIRLMADSTVLVEGFTPITDIEPRLPGQRAPSVVGGLPDLTGLTVAETLDVCERIGVTARPQGTGIAVMQSLPPGPVEQGAVVDVLFEAPA
ncbi:penicillin-binding transpeptidase domain-containing protein [Paraliomyxa miuraensis]|uniref:penicillin-binding transpeptidase domain-containing protein n=1 Tax=Paraliomyxa miuraensis TaxID=376150 RepID=UPI002259939E|nr:penicillin-binding transpeptidase domain-containing protein [Paraliomyxa miuraensis]MCX4247594.1 penicillin-binding transpeptidase domain-containing protein [Paraliomyxa miuraensis]